MSTESTSAPTWEELCAEYDDQSGRSRDHAVSVDRGTLDDRHWSRARVPDADRSCEVKMGDQVFPARLLNKSAEGFGVLVACPDCPRVGQQVQLQTEKGWLPIRVVYVQAMQNKDAELGERHPGPYFRLGCTRRLRRSLWSRLLGR